MQQLRELLLPLLRDALDSIGAPPETPVVLDLPRKNHRGEIATGVAFRLAGPLGSPPERIAGRIVAAMRKDGRRIERIEVAGGGFINITLTPQFYQSHLAELLARPEGYGRNNGGAGAPVAVDHLAGGSGRGDAEYRGPVIADTIARMLRRAGHTVAILSATGDAGLNGDILNRLGVEPGRLGSWDGRETIGATLAELNDRGATTGAAGNARLIADDHGDAAFPLTDAGEPTMLLRMADRYHQLLLHGSEKIVLVTDERHAGISRAIAAACTILGHPPDSIRGVLYTGLPSGIDREAALRASLDANGPQATRLFMLRGDAHGELPGDGRWARTLRDPLHAIQYTHFTVGTMLDAAGRLVAERGAEPIDRAASIAPLVSPPERELMRKLLMLPWIIERGALDLQPRIIIDYLNDLAGVARVFYRSCRIIAEESGIRDARLRLLGAAHMALGEGLTALGIPPTQSI